MIERARVAGFFADGRRSTGLMIDGGIADLAEPLREFGGDIIACIAAGALAKLVDGARSRPVDFGPAEFSYEIPVARPEKIICIGVNYPDRNEEYKDNQPAAAYPSLFIRFPRSFVGHQVPLIRPKVSEQLDYEGEVAIIVGRPGRHITESDAFGHIAAISLCNEGSVRDWMRHSKFNVTQGKNFESSGSMGPWIVPFEDEDQIADIALTTRVNGAIRQQDRTSRMLFGFRRLVAYISSFTTLAPGDIIVTGTPTGAGARLVPPVWLRPGDIVEVEAEGIGLLRNGVRDEP